VGSPAYEVIASGGGTRSGQAHLGLVHRPAHPVLAGVTGFDGGSSSHRPWSTVLTSGARLLAEWTDGSVLAAQGRNPRRVDLGFYPPSSRCAPGLWDPTTDGALLLANALEHVAGAGAPPPVTYCRAGTTSSGCQASLSSLGLPSLIHSGPFTLLALGVEGKRNGIFFYGASGRSYTPWGNSTSWLCVKSPVQRMNPPQNSGGVQGQCNGLFAADWNAYFASNPAKAVNLGLVAGTVVDAQAWYRDPAAGTGPPGARGTALSDALEFLVLP
jgi:hypothetical protein